MTDDYITEPRGRALSRLLEDTEAGGAPEGGDTPISAITTSSNDVVDGSLFIAIRGTSTDGHRFIEDAVAQGAAAVVVDRDYHGDPGVPVVRAHDTRRATAELAAAWYGHPARHMRLVGITGSIGKTSILSMLEAILAEAGIRAGTIGSLGVHIDGESLGETGHTAPGPLLLHRELARIADEGCDLAAMEVTSHALVQERVHGLRFDLGVFTNLVPLEHSEYHPTFRDYADAKRRLFDYMRPCAPLVYNADSQIVRRMVHDSDAEPIGCGTGRAAMVRIQPGRMDARGTSFSLEVRRPITLMDGGKAPTGSLNVDLELLGYSNMTNAALAATTALSIGVAPARIRSALARVPRQPRRLEVVHNEDFMVLDDTVGHPDSISALFQVVQRLAPRAVHIVLAVRGQRGEEVNRHTAEALGIWTRRVPLGELVVTRSEEAADERNRVEDAEARAVEEALKGMGVSFKTRSRLKEAVEDVVSAGRVGDLVLLLGAQGMDGGQEVARRWLAERRASG